MSAELPASYAQTLRTLLRYAAVMTIVGLLSGVLYQESAKKLDLSEVGVALHLEARIHLALVHGHMLTTGVLIPIAMGAALYLARAAGGSELGRAPLRWLTRGYLPLVSVALGLMLYKAYHVLLSVRFGEHDLAKIDEAYFGGIQGLRHGVYGLTHTGMAVSLGIFMVAIFRSLKGAGAATRS